MAAQMTRSNQDIFYHPTLDDSGGGEPLVNLKTVSGTSDIMATDMTSDFVTVDEALQGLVTDSLSNTENVTEGVNLEDAITGINQEQSLIFTDTETGMLDSSDQIYQGGYRDVYRLSGLGKNETVTLNLEAFGFGSSLKLMNSQTEEILPQYDAIETEGTAYNELIFTTENNIDYVVRVTSIEQQTTGNYTLGTTLGQLTETLIFSDTETGVLDSSDQTHQGLYRDEYILRGVEEQQTVILNLDGVEFGDSLQLVNRETGEVIQQSQMTEDGGNTPLQLTFTSNNNIEYLVRVTSIEETETGSYTLGTTSGDLILGLSDQTIQGSITEDDGTLDVWDRSNTDVYEITNFSYFQTINVTLDSFDHHTMLLLIDADTGERITSNIGSYNSEEGCFSANLTYTPTRDDDTNYALVATFYNSDRLGDYTLSVDTSFSLSGGFNSDYETTYNSLRNRLMDNFLISDVQVGQDIELNLDSDYSNQMIQLFNQDTGDLLQSTTAANLQFTVEEGINYGVRVVGGAGQTYDLTTNTGILFDSNPIELNQTITNSLATSDAAAYFKSFGSNSIYYSDGYYVSGDDLHGEDQLTITIDDSDFLPDLHIVNAQTGDIIDSYNHYDFDNDILSYDLSVEEGIDYLFVVSSRYRQEVGEYTFAVNSNQ